MNETDQASTPADEPTVGSRRGPTVLVLLSSDANRDVLSDALSDRYTVLLPDNGSIPSEEFDLCVLDERSLARYGDELRRYKERARPLFLPYLLVTDRPTDDPLPGRVWRQVDDVIRKPASPVALHNRLQSQIRTRTLSIQFARSEARFSALIRTATDAIFILDKTATIVFVNPAVRDVLGYGPHSLVGRPVTVLIPERFRDAAEAGIDRMFTSGEVGAIDSIDSRALHRAGHEVPVRLSYNQFPYDGRVFIAGIVHDVTDITRREQWLSVLNRVLRHDIRNDVNVIQGWAERLRLTGENIPEYTGYIEEKAEEIVRLSDQARQMEQLSRSGDDGLHAVELVGRLTHQLTRLQREHPAVDVCVDVPERADVLTFDLVDSAIDNVLENAVKHNDSERPRLDVRVSTVGPDEVELRVVDDGPGIPIEELAALERGDEAPLAHTSGLGLWITKWLVSESGGWLRFEHAEPSGTVVSMTFRAVDEASVDD